ncbi:DUF6197 family protein [Actinomadura rupiterrae]|uniref:DUF6197 family protein n=1 Tax=Actinomadura rupiterrae TaxID=559627 RepID=UPI0020A2404B|nr:hypothetical protein [Actinomadura rupiterrae]MCP2339230.1 hypothetical protein [Actinomadura rupiterrae]
MKTSTILDRAADHLSKYGWIKGFLYSPGMSEPLDRRPCCLIGALNCAETGTPKRFGSDAPLEALARHLDLDGDDAVDSRLLNWNDSDARTEEDVLAALRETAATEREAGR